MKPLISNVVVAVSGSDASLDAARYGIVLSKAYGSTLTAVYVVDTATLRTLVLTRIFVEEESREYEQSLIENEKRYLEFVKSLGASKKVRVETELRTGAISTEILQEANERRAQLILLGGLPARHDSRDSVSLAQREILSQAQTSVLIVREPQIEAIFRTY